MMGPRSRAKVVTVRLKAMEPRGGMTTMRAIIRVLKKIKSIKLKTIESVTSFYFITNLENVLLTDTCA